ncbi:MAG: WD40 repeat domain-containing protein [Magnetococcales bacterium]|nr:WD40 repeat domain-containing protein [Magnetococcales bacterium]
MSQSITRHAHHSGGGWLWLCLLLMVQVSSPGSAGAESQTAAGKNGGSVELEHASAEAENASMPLLRLDTRLRSHVERPFGVDEDGRRIAAITGPFRISIWNGRNGKLDRTIRLPAKRRENERLNAIALSRDGATLAVGTVKRTPSCSGNAVIYLIDVETRQVNARISTIPDSVMHMAFSINGRHLAAGLKTHGLRIHRTDDGTLAASDDSYKGAVNGLDFAADGRLVTSSDDGYVRLYDILFSPIAKVRPKGGERPHPVRFSPDSWEIAVGFSDVAAVNILSGKDLSHFHAPNVSAIQNRYLDRIAWSSDTHTLYAAGDSGHIRKWMLRGRGRHQDLKVGEGAILDLRSRWGGGIYFASNAPFLGAIDENDTFVSAFKPPAPDSRIVEKRRSEPSGPRVTVGEPEKIKRPERIQPGKSGVIRVTGWKHSREPRLNGRLLPLDPLETSRALAISKDGRKFVLGASWHLYLFDYTGKKIWKVQTPGSTWEVRISKNGRIVEAVFGDKTVRQYRMDNGEEITANFLPLDGFSSSGDTRRLIGAE